VSIPTRNLLPDAFAGTAEAYARYRPPYPAALLAELLREAGVPADGRVLDLACGPGRIALDLAPRVAQVWAIDLEPEMVAYGRAEAERRGLANLRWSVGPAEALDAPPAAFDLITIGEAFHRLDQPVIAAKAFAWLKPGGALATLGSRGILRGPEPWQQAATRVAERWTAKAFPQGWAVSRTGVEQGPADDAAVLAAAGFTPPLDRKFTQPRAWTFDEVLGYLQSTSVASRRVLGDDFAAFADDLRNALQPFEQAGFFREDLGFGYTSTGSPSEWLKSPSPAAT
jgi:SAM-dependent methyltransferase